MVSTGSRVQSSSTAPFFYRKNSCTIALMINVLANIETSDASASFVLIATLVLVIVLLTGYVLMQEYSRGTSAHKKHSKAKAKRKARK